MSNHIQIRLPSQANQGRLASEWDKVGPLRDRDLADGNDRSFTDILKPWILDNCSSGGSILEIGCGTGRLAAELWTVASHVSAIDPSGASIKIAREHDQRTDYHVSSLSEWVLSWNLRPFDVLVANMVLMDVPDLPEFLGEARSLLNGGRFVATFTHPAFWPRYWGYESLGHFEYDRQLEVSAPFRTRQQEYELYTTHYHRPFGYYLRSFIEAGFQFIKVDELRGPESLSEFPFPRFVAVSAAVR